MAWPWEVPSAGWACGMLGSARPDRVLETEMGVVGVDVVPGGQDCLL